jgi:hypothetical protein
VIGRFPGERSCLSLVWAVLDRASRGWRGLRQTIPSIRLLAELRRELFDQPALTDEEVVAQMSQRPRNIVIRSLPPKAFTPNLGRHPAEADERRTAFAARASDRGLPSICMRLLDAAEMIELLQARLACALRPLGPSELYWLGTTRYFWPVAWRP